jgi:prepilin-type N-terminal cleavage/methylation domain-containing protein
MKLKINRKSSSGFTLIEMIGVLAIIGILASVVAPKVIEAIRDAKVTSSLANLNTIKSAAINYYARYNSYVPDSTKLAVEPGSTPPTGWNRSYGKTGVLTAPLTNFGDILMSEGLLEKIASSLGTSGTTQGANASSATAVVGISTSDYPEVLCKTITTTKQFTGAQNATRIITFRIPAVSLLEAAAMKTKVDGPFTATQINGASDLVTKTVGGSGSTEAINVGNCRIAVSSTSPSTVGQAGSTYDVYLYAAHD